MAGVDTNVLVRYLVRDDPVQTDAAERCLQAAVDNGAPIRVALTVVLELEWVLRSRYRFDKSAWQEVLHALLSTPDIVLEAADTLEHALLLYSEHSADFADSLHAASYAALRAVPMWTFDARAAALPGAMEVKVFTRKMRR